MTPMGDFHVPITASNQKHYVAFAAGSGITPVISIIKEILLREPGSTFALFYGNRTTETIIFRETLEGLKNKYLDRFALFHILSREDQGSGLFTGRIDGTKLARIFSGLIGANEVDEYFLCGPVGMVQELKAFLKHAGVARNTHRPETDTVGETQVRIRLDGNDLNFTMASRQKSLLDAALAAGADLPFSCKGGVCCTCKARVLEGSAEMKLNYALEPEEVKAGYILTCQAYPTSSGITIDFDQ
jgi:ring-1,2-phenylacetyl-CoA epoxidase subunit PaaE